MDCDSEGVSPFPLPPPPKVNVGGNVGGADDATTASNIPSVDTPSLVPRKRLATSEVWNYFTKKGVGDDGKPKAECNGCKTEFTAGGTTHGTSSLSRHMKNCLILQKYEDVGQMMIDHAGKMKSKKINQETVRELMAMAIVKHDLPFSFVEYEGIRDLMKYLNPDIKFITRNTAAADVWKVYLSKKEILN